MLQPSPRVRFHHVYFDFLQKFILKMNAISGSRNCFCAQMKETCSNWHFFWLDFQIYARWFDPSAPKPIPKSGASLRSQVGVALQPIPNSKVWNKVTLTSWRGFATNSKFHVDHLSLKRAGEIPARMWPRKYPRMNADCQRHAVVEGVAGFLFE